MKSRLAINSIIVCLVIRPELLRGTNRVHPNSTFTLIPVAFSGITRALPPTLYPAGSPEYPEIGDNSFREQMIVAGCANQQSIIRAERNAFLRF
jgi:hypothetical protein